MKLSSVSVQLFLLLSCIAVGTLAWPQTREIDMHGHITYPGTKWCGRGNTSTAEERYGKMVNTDKCCEAHDGCPASVPGMTWKYFRYNKWPVSLTHCHCDDTLFNCLKTVQKQHPEEKDTAEAIGQWFFEGKWHGIQVAPTMPCFVFTTDCACVVQPKWDIMDWFCKKWGMIEGVGRKYGYLAHAWHKFDDTYNIPGRPNSFNEHNIDKLVKFLEKVRIGTIEIKVDVNKLPKCDPKDKPDF